MKGILLVIVSIGIIGYAWYADVLPLNSQNTSTALSPTVENIQQISSVILSNENKIVYYSFEDVPIIPDKQIPINALKKTIETWEKNNPHLKFVQSENSNIEIKWQKYASSTHTGLATCNSVLFGILSHCILDISVGVENCNGDFVQNDENMVTNIMMHEIGHALGLKHTSETGELMYSPISLETPFDTKGYVIPDRFEELYIGQKALLAQQNKMHDKIKSLNIKISRAESQYEEYYKQYQYYEGKTLSPDEYNKSKRVFDKLNSEVENINSMIEQQNMMVDQINEILNLLGCDPNFVITS